MKFLITALMLALPASVYTQLVWSVDRYEKEPPLYLLYAFLWGAIPAIIAAIVFQSILSVPILFLFGSSSFAGEFTQAALGAPVTEEILKGLGVALLYLTRRHEFDGWVDGIVYGATAGFGFAYVENIFYLMGTSSWEEWAILFVLRAMVFGGLHGFWTALTGIGFGLARYTHDRLIQVFVIAGGLLLAIVGHLIHNAAATLVEVTNGTSFGLAFLNYGALAIVMVLLWLVAGIVDRRRLKHYLQDEVPTIIPAAVYQAICDRRCRAKLMQLHIPQAVQKQLLQLAGELAQKKLQLTKMGDESGNYAEINRLRIAMKELVRR
ncbi:MAG: PrsW family intramembrane metalloprotease [Cyanobacteria bacterium P01_F01_bin.86]